MKKSIWLMVILFVMAGGVYTYAFFASKRVTNASTVPSCCTEITNASDQTTPVQNSGCGMVCPTDVTTCPPSTPTSFKPPTGNNTVAKPKTTTEPCDNCVCGTDEECPNQDKCDACIEEEQRDEGKKGIGSGNQNGGQNRNGQKNRK